MANPMTVEGEKRLREELAHRKGELRKEIVEAISEARAHGDLKENAEYHAARERQGFIEGRLAELEDVISRADVIDPSTLKGKEIRFGATVKLEDEDTGKENTYQIVGSYEADVDSGKLSVTSPCLLYTSDAADE